MKRPLGGPVESLTWRGRTPATPAGFGGTLRVRSGPVLAWIADKSSRTGGVISISRLSCWRAGPIEKGYSINLDGNSSSLEAIRWSGQVRPNPGLVFTSSIAGSARPSRRIGMSFSRTTDRYGKQKTISE